MRPRRVRTDPRRAPRQRRSVETVEVLLVATERVLAKHGFAAATTNRIAETAGVSIGTLYRFFPSKDALVEALVQRLWSEEMAVLERNAPALLAGGGPAAVRAVVGELVEVTRARSAMAQRWFSEAGHLGALPVALANYGRAADLIEAALAAYVGAGGRVRPEKLRFAADLTVKMVLGALRPAARDYPAEMASGELADELSDMVVRYLFAE